MEFLVPFSLPHDKILTRQMNEVQFLVPSSLPHKSTRKGQMKDVQCLVSSSVSHKSEIQSPLRRVGYTGVVPHVISSGWHILLPFIRHDRAICSISHLSGLCKKREDSKLVPGKKHVES